MKTVAPHDRPREKLERAGAATLGDNELLAIVLGHMTRALLSVLRFRQGEWRRIAVDIGPGGH